MLSFLYSDVAPKLRTRETVVDGNKAFGSCARGGLAEQDKANHAKQG